MDEVKITIDEIKALMCVMMFALECADSHKDEKPVKELNTAAAVVLRLYTGYIREKFILSDKEQATTEILEQLTATMRNESLPTCERLRAAELLGKYYKLSGTNAQDKESAET